MMSQLSKYTLNLHDVLMLLWYAMEGQSPKAKQDPKDKEKKDVVNSVNILATGHLTPRSPNGGTLTRTPNFDKHASEKEFPFMSEMEKKPEASAGISPPPVRHAQTKLPDPLFEEEEGSEENISKSAKGNIDML